MCACLQKPGWEFEIPAKCLPSVSFLKVWCKRKSLCFFVCVREKSNLEFGDSMGLWCTQETKTHSCDEEKHKKRGT